MTSGWQSRCRDRQYIDLETHERTLLHEPLAPPDVDRGSRNASHCSTNSLTWVNDEILVEVNHDVDIGRDYLQRVARKSGARS